MINSKGPYFGKFHFYRHNDFGISVFCIAGLSNETGISRRLDELYDRSRKRDYQIPKAVSEFSQ
jgi:hypothetical protein